MSNSAHFCPLLLPHRPLRGHRPPAVDCFYPRAKVFNFAQIGRVAPRSFTDAGPLRPQPRSGRRLRPAYWPGSFRFATRTRRGSALTRLASAIKRLHRVGTSLAPVARCLSSSARREGQASPRGCQRAAALTARRRLRPHPHRPCGYAGSGRSARATPSRPTVRPSYRRRRRAPAATSAVKCSSA